MVARGHTPEGFQAALFLEPEHHFGPGWGGGVRWPQRHVYHVNWVRTIQLLNHPGQGLQLLEPRVASGCRAGPCRSRTFPSFPEVPLDGPLPVAPPPECGSLSVPSTGLLAPVSSLGPRPERPAVASWQRPFEGPGGRFRFFLTSFQSAP